MTVTADVLQQAIDRVERVRLLALPTPLEPMPRLSAALGGPRLWIKRDDLTGLALGGNKSRYLEFTLAEAVGQGADAVVLSAVVQSNHCRQFAAAAARLGLEAVVVLRQDDTPMGRSQPATGNYLLDRLFGAAVRLAPRERVAAAVEEEMDRLRSAGRRPFTGLSALLSRVAYVQCAVELSAQCDAAGLRPDAVAIASGSNSLAGLVAGFHLLGRATRFVGVPQGPVGDPRRAAAQVAALAGQAGHRLGLACDPDPAVVEVDDRAVGDGFGRLDLATRQAVQLLARTEGVLVDPAYTGKGLAGLMRQVREGRFDRGADVVFVHTGGTPLVFTYGEDLLA